MIINLARLGRSGTGMWNYSINFLDCVNDLDELDGIICANMHKEFFGARYEGCDIFTVPDFVTNTTTISKIRPIYWFLYSFVLSFKLRMKFKNNVLVSTTHHFLPLVEKQIITIHDLRPYYYPDSRFQRVYFRFLIRNKVKRMLHILTVSNTVKNKIVETYNVKKENISVIYNVVNKCYYEEITLLPNQREGEAKGYYLCVGCNWKHKNIHSFIENCTETIVEKGLVIVCGKTSYTAELYDLVEKLGLKSNVIFRHDVSQDMLRNLYTNALCLIYPSIDEGFGIPPIESFACKTPVILSDIPVFRELFGERGIYVNINDSNDWSRVISEVSNFSVDDKLKLKEFSYGYSLEGMSDMISKFITKIPN
ncbi:glycosyltransferase family 4 protein [Klebsiella pneumoniae]|uniref:glycosyltransferase family 4 protein n=1 Tax=Klebsiella pneumoniae complex TaxID=3390273 RepID=UPI0021DABAC4|nr:MULTISPECIES: glycosyltransferase family 1 protein [Klebsiella]MCU8815362.1 glycosyltransferase family 4 protein [Klebsiella quasipneumoniae]MEC4082780.1 glycosyltransferase family 1 protein [Klebsiella pneumoniae]